MYFLLLFTANCCCICLCHCFCLCWRYCCCCYCRRLPFMFLLLLFIRLFERQRNGRVAKLPLRTFFVFLWACVCVCLRAVCTSASNSFAFYNCTKKEEGTILSRSLSLSIPHSRCLVHRLTTSRSRLAVCCWRLVARFFIIVLQWRRNKHTHRNYLLDDCRQKRGAGGRQFKDICAYKSIIAVCRWLNTRQELTREGSKRNLNKCEINTNKI